MLRIVLKNGTLIFEMNQKPKKGLLNGEACSPYMGYKPDSIWSDCGMKIDLMAQPEDLYDIRPSASYSQYMAPSSVNLLHRQVERKPISIYTTNHLTLSEN